MVMTLYTIVPVLAGMGVSVYVLVLLIRALRKYLRTAPVRAEKAVSKWESGTSDPSTSNLLALAKLFGIDAKELLDETKNAE